MEENSKSSVNKEMVNKEAPRLVSLLKEMKDRLDAVRSKVQALTIKVKENNFPTADGINYLEAKHLLLLSCCESIVYYLLRKAKGLSIEGHPVVQSLVEIRLFLEKVFICFLHTPNSLRADLGCLSGQIYGHQKFKDLISFNHLGFERHCTVTLEHCIKSFFVCGRK